MKHSVLSILAALAVTGLIVAGCSQSDDATPASSGADTAAAVATESQTTTSAEPAAAVPAATNQSANVPAAEATSAPAARIDLAQADFSAVEAAGFVEGRHYQRISPAQPTSTSPGQIEVNEFFMHTCGHCRTLEPYVEAWLETKPDFINFVRVPTTWSDLNTIHAQAYYTAESLGIEDEIMNPFFVELHERGNALESGPKLAAFFSNFGVSQADFEQHYSSFSVATKVSNAARLADRYSIDATPTIVINGKFKTGVGEAGGYAELFELIELLAAAERAQ